MGAKGVPFDCGRVKADVFFLLVPFCNFFASAMTVGKFGVAHSMDGCGLPGVSNICDLYNTLQLHQSAVSQKKHDAFQKVRAMFCESAMFVLIF